MGKGDRYKVKFSLFNKDRFSNVYSTDYYNDALNYAMRLYSILGISGIGNIIIVDKLTNVEIKFDVDNSKIRINASNAVCC